MEHSQCLRRFVALRMTNVVGVDSIHGSIRSCKLQAITWARTITLGLDTDMWARDGGFLGRHSSIGVL